MSYGLETSVGRDNRELTGAVCSTANNREDLEMGKIGVHEFMSLDGIIEATWTVEYDFAPEMAEAIGRITSRSDAILLGRTTYEMFAPAWSTGLQRTIPGRPSSTTLTSTLSPPR
jgi:hypothetical protein